MKNYSLIYLFACLLIVSCSKDEIELGPTPKPTEVSKRPFFTKFWLSQDCNDKLNNDYLATIETDSTIILFCQEFETADSIIPSFEGNYVSVKVNGLEQFSGISVQDFSTVLKYELLDSVGNKAYYDVKIQVFNKIPRVDIITEGGVEITSKKEYVNATFKISNCPEMVPIASKGRIRGRGNATWNYAKKPYKIKFNEKQTPFGFSANKDWVLLAEACDRTLLRTAYMCETSKAANMDFTINYQHVDLFLNKKYLGTYIWTDQVEKAKDRVKIDKDGFLIENDGYYNSEPLYFVTDSLRMAFSFKYPDADDGDIVEGDESFNFIVSFMNKVERELLTLKYNPDTVSFESSLDIKSFAKWYLVAELTATYDPNRFYVLPNRDSKLKMYPIWDAEWSLGVWPTSSWGNPPESMSTRVIWKGSGFYQYLFKSEVFIKEVKAEWKKLKTNISIIKENINSTAKSISLSQRSNFYRWPGSGGPTLNVLFDTWEDEVKYINKFFDDRVEWMDKYINSL